MVISQCMMLLCVSLFYASCVFYCKLLYFSALSFVFSDWLFALSKQGKTAAMFVCSLTMLYMYMYIVDTSPFYMEKVLKASLNQQACQTNQHIPTS